MQFTFWTILICAFSIMTYSESSSVVRLCGRKLVNAMKALCNHRYMTPETPSLTQHHSPQSKNGIAQHCCFRPCSYTYLKSFCDDQQFISTTTTEQYNNELNDAEFVENDERRFTGKNSQSRQVPVKTFRSLFHLLSYISQLWSNQMKNATAEETTK